MLLKDPNPDEGDSASHVPATSGATLLPRPVASLISLLTQSTSLSLRLGTFVGGFALDSARTTTLTGLELSRAVIENILTRAGRDVAARCGDEHGRAEAESLLERSLATLHATVTSASFFAAATFHFSSTTLSSVVNFSQALLSTLDAILGSTESSRAIAAIITVIRREFRSVESGVSAEKIGVSDLLIGTIGFALLQRWGKKNTERYLHENGGDEIIWDVVILDNGARADVVGTHQVQLGETREDELPPEPSSAASFVMPGKGDGGFDAVHRRASMAESIGGSRLSFPLDGQQPASDEDIRAYVMSQLPAGCHASVRSEALTARTITVDIFDDDMAEIAAPPGTTMIEERFHHDNGYANTNTPEYQRLPKHTMVFRTAFNRSQSTELHPYDAYPPESEPGPQTLPPGNQRTMTQPHLAVSNGTPHGMRNQVSPEAAPMNAKSARSSFTKFAQRVKPAEKNEVPKRPPPLKKPPKASESSRATSSRQTARPVKGAGAVKEATAREQGARPDPRRPSTPAPNRGIPRSPLPHPSPRQSQSPQQTKHAPSRDAHHRGNIRPNYYAMRERSQESLVTQTDTYSRRTTDRRPGSPATTRKHVRSSSSMSVTRSEADTTVSPTDYRPSSSALHHRSHSYTPSMYSLATAGSETSLVLAHRPRKSAYEDMETIHALHRDGYVPGIFPERHFVQNIRRFCRFSSASYGSNALKVMGVPKGSTKSLPPPPPGPSSSEPSDTHEHSAFSDHAGLPPSTILLSSFVDPAGGSNAAGETETGFPLVHYLCIDHDSKAVVLTLRGTWGFEDILTDMTCDYDELDWQGKTWKVHKGMHASARRLLDGGGARVMITLRAALEEFPTYGVVLCGHSLGGGVAALLATMISKPSTAIGGTSTRRLSHLVVECERPSLLPPPNRPIHVYAYGPPAVMSPFLRLATRGLITTVVNGADAVPSLSLGIVHDMHSAAMAFKSDNASGARTHVSQRLRESLRQSIVHKFYVNQPPLVVNAGDGVGEDAWAWKTLRLLRDQMSAPKLVPPGEVFVVQTMRVLQRDAFVANSSSSEIGVSDAYPRLGRPATRVQLRFVRDVEAWFGELRFAAGMLSDHNPARYETSLAAVSRGVIDE
ncbi:hypothetical protein N7510_005402 [Penicillium lagena]|uniref:uncharacterized protein n=1 Tax=Penicillium lagena TaxID=94218 RepID=UPI00253FE837|nr:uncharacterized protein N7510_005402 [Penicillium lagena]KAJ5612208.1 hypothetical protein N7510_005402 [Penicillium lagena]